MMSGNFGPGAGLAAGLMAAALLAGCMQGTEAQKQEPAYVVASAEDAFEVRSYDARVAARHTGRGTYRRAVEQGYIRLERYFTGENAVPEPIPMEVPVMVRAEGAEGWTIMFPLPRRYRVETAPPPVDGRIRLVELPPRRVAAVKFGGELGESVLREQGARLAAWLEARGLEHRGDFTMASYDPPWKPVGRRANEVLVTLR